MACSYDEIYPRNVTELSYRITTAEAGRQPQSHRAGEGSRDAHVYISYQSRSSKDTHAVRQALSRRGFQSTDLSQNEMVHGRNLRVDVFAPRSCGA